MARANELALLKLSHSELRVYLALSYLETRWGDVVASMDDMSIHTIAESGWITYRKR